MSNRRIYFDYNASAPLRRGARVAMTAALNLTGNASSVHGEGRTARAVIERSREQVAHLLGAEPGEVVFTSGGTEANNWILSAGWDVIFIAGIEHESILAPARAAAKMGARIVKVPVDTNGVVLIPELRVLLNQYLAEAEDAEHGGKRRALLSLQMANNETGVVQPLAKVAAMAKARGVMVHSDAVQAVGRQRFSFRDLGADFITVSGHKIGAPQGVGALLLKSGLELKRFILGGGQERRWRAGTENVAAIAGFGSAAEAATRELAVIHRLTALRDCLEWEITRITPEAMVIGSAVSRLANTICVALPGTSAETMVIKLDLDGIAVSAGSACSSGKVGASHVLEAMGLDETLSRSAIRISLGWGSSEEDIELFLESWKGIAAQGARIKNVA